MPESPSFAPDRVAYFEAAGWRAYYDHKWLRVFRLMVGLNREQFGMSLPTAILAATDIVLASVAFAPVENDIPATLAHLQRYYAKARRAAGLKTEAREMARLEVDYWIVHRRLANERKQSPTHDGDIEPMVDSLRRLHKVLFPKAASASLDASARERALAAVAVDRITGGYSPDIAADWDEVEQRLRQAYRQVVMR
ncbi:MAG: hypothetical protein J5I90_22295 [Caldilineales bacterium]|nr:hypothetical protein [Caldilineales bacterium]